MTIYVYSNLHKSIYIYTNPFIMSNLSAFALAPVYDLLTGFANRDDFWGLFDAAFGTQYDSGVAQGFRSQWLAGDFGDFPEVEVVSSQVLGTANGAYAASTNRIYWSCIKLLLDK